MMIGEREVEARLEALRGAISADGPMAAGVMSRIQEGGPLAPWTRRRRRGWLLRSAIGLAAAGVAVIALFPLFPLPTVAYDIDDLTEALLKVKSIHVKSLIRHFDDQGNVTQEATRESFSERPYRSWQQCLVYLNQDPPRINYFVRDGERTKYVDPTAKTCTLSDDTPLWAELSMEREMQRLLLHDRQGDSPEQFHKVGEEKIDGQPVHRYERIQLRNPARNDGYRVVVWLNPATALPVRRASYSFKGRNVNDLTRSVVNEIEFNVPPRPEMFDFAPPQGYAVIHEPGDKNRLPRGEGGAFNNEHFERSLALNIDDRALLVCWAAYDASQEPALEVELNGPAGRIIEPGKFGVLSGPIKYRHVFIRADRADGFHRRWSLFVPEDPRRRIGWDSPELRMKHGPTSISLDISGVRFPRERLARLVIELQRLTLPPDAPENAAMTLDEIEELIDAVKKGQNSP